VEIWEKDTIPPRSVDFFQEGKTHRFIEEEKNRYIYSSGISGWGSHLAFHPKGVSGEGEKRPL
jgi:hypothetical protein